MASDFNPNGVPEILATILQRLNQQDVTARETREEIKQRIDDTKRDLGERMAAVKNDLGSRIDDLKTKVDTTNGRLLKQEALTIGLPLMRVDLDEAKTELAKNKIWRAGVAGKITGISLAAGSAVGFIGWAIDAYILHGTK